MDYFKKYLAGEPGKAVPSGADTVEKLCDRVRTSTLLDDRRDAVRALKSLSKKFRVDVGNRAMGILIDVLKKDGSDTEILSHALEAIYNVISNEDADEPHAGGGSSLDASASVANGPPAGSSGEEAGVQFAEAFLKEADSVGLLLSLLDEYDFHVRRPTVRLLTALLAARPRVVQEAVLICPMGVSKLTDLLSDSREVVRNDALLLLAHLARGNASIQKIVAFENAFERVLAIAGDEGLSDGGVVVEDCLRLLLGLLKDNKSNQTYFVEGGYVQRLRAFFEPEALAPTAAAAAGGGGWSAQKVANVQCALHVVRALVAPSGGGAPPRETAACQRLMAQCGLLQRLCDALMASGVPADVLTTCVSAVSESIRGFADGQAYFAGVLAPSSPPRPAVVVLLMSMVNERQPLALRNAALYCFQCFLYRNDVGQSQVVQTLLPTAAEAAGQLTAGQLLCSGLFSPDALSAWYAAVALTHAVLGGGPDGARTSAANKEALLRVQLTTSIGNPPVSLLQQCMNILTGQAKLQTKIGLLMFLITWLADCCTGVAMFLSVPGNVSYLTSQVTSNESEESDVIAQGLCAALLGVTLAYGSAADDKAASSSRDNVRGIVEKRIGLELFAERLGQVSKHESYSAAAKRPYISCKQASDVLFDHEFTALYKSLEMDILRAARGRPPSAMSSAIAAGAASMPGAGAGASNDAGGGGGGIGSSISNHDSIVGQYKELIREQDAALAHCRVELAEVKAKADEGAKEVAQLRDLVQQLKDQNALLKAHKSSSSSAAAAGGGNSSSETAAAVGVGGDDRRLSGEIERLRHLLAERDAELSRVAAATATGGADVAASSSAAAAAAAALAAMQQEAAELRRQLSAALAIVNEKDAELLSLSERLAASERAAAETTVASARQAEGELVAALREELARARTVASDKETEADDLLVLLEEQSQKIKAHRQRLRAAGVSVSSEDEDAGGDEDEEGDDDDK